jgi:uncharacterized protein YbjT (DUF2867 family)
MSGFTAVLAGATGLVGGECLARLLASRSYGRVVVVTRRPLTQGGHHRKLESVVTDFDRLGEFAARFAGDHVFCALGTTIRRAGSQARFRVVDHDYPLQLASITREQGARHFSLVSALGASRSSPFFYSRVKGELEDDLKRMGWPSLALFRPSVIAGERGESRPLERLGERMLRLAPATLRPVEARDIAAAMIATARDEPARVTVVESRDIAAVAAGFSAGPD